MTKHGGARPGSGRKRRVVGAVSDIDLHVLVTPGEARRIDAVAGASGMSRSAWLRSAIADRLLSDTKPRR